MKPWVIVLLVVLVILIAAFIALYIFGSKMQKKSEAAQKQMQIGAQTVSMLIIDKKRMKITEAGLPKIVVDQTPKYLRRSKVPIVKAKIGPKIMTFMCDEKIYDLIPIKASVKATINGIYIMNVKGLRTPLDKRPEKVGFFKKIKNKISKK